MKNKTKMIHQNIHNLTSLWTEAGRFKSSFVSSSRFNHVACDDLQWPNRLWFHDDLDQESLEQAKEHVFAESPNLIVPYWDIYGSDSEQLLAQNGFVKLFEQTGMSLKLHEPYEEQIDLKITRVSTREEAITWSKLFFAAFGYEIHPDLIMHTHVEINYYIAHYQTQAIGTAITYQTGEVTGIHAMGIAPAGRRKGLANQLMNQLLHLATEDKSQYVTLQASEMGKGLYLKLGFAEEFKIKNYRLTDDG
ncbi:GNAT family N-acetyltransferase [Reichenbachiella agariperforans]|uniref:GNAT family N-acetyltransferase n=1 Tax=Reichenbachiella agariperforans TaxID=156994 RepID=UPI001C0950D5|nr:GNAT family N-acetyltransferase [Reichenbachiella agariperforans]MBU2913577.1 GNAT family N-acetyltransferase [Reichenbachiella agariperforans]